MGVRAVVFDIGGVLSIGPQMDFTDRWERRLGLPQGEIGRRTLDIWLAGNVGSITESQVQEGLCTRLGIDSDTAESMLSDVWAQYLGVANTELIEYLRSLRPPYRTALLSNSFVGAREREQAAYGFEDLVDDIVYSHEVGIEKPDPRIYALTCTRLGVPAADAVFVDDAEMAIAGAAAAGMAVVRHLDNASTIAAVDALLVG